MLYSYKANDEKNKIVRGSLEADTLTDFYSKLDEKNLICLSYAKAESVREKGQYKLNSKDLILFCKKISTMLGAGMTITNCLDVMYTTETKLKLKQNYLNLYELVKSGKPLSESLRLIKGSFPNLLINMIESGEESGNVDMIMGKLSGYYERQSKINSKIKTATIYPKILAIVATLVIVILFTFVLPEIFKVFESESQIPGITRFMMAVSSTLTTYWYIYIVGLAAVIIFTTFALKLPDVKLIKDRLAIRMFLVGPLVKKIYSARFASTLSILYASGISLLNAIGLSMNVIENSYIEESLKKVVEKVSVGQSLSTSIVEVDIFDGLLASMIKIGEESGSLDTILESISVYYEAETDSAIESLLAILEPVLLVIMAVIIGVVLVSVMLPIFQMYNQLGTY